MSQTIQFVVDVEIEDDEADVSNIELSHVELEDGDEDLNFEFSWAARRVDA